jgi:SEC-C motif
VEVSQRKSTTFRQRVERCLPSVIEELQAALANHSTVAVLAHYQMRLYAALDKSNLPDGFWAKWRYIWALALQMPYSDGDDAADTDFSEIDHQVEKIFEVYLTGAIFERGATPGSQKEFLARLGLAISTREPDLIGFPEQIRSWALSRLQPFNASYFQPQFGMTFEEVFRWLDSLMDVLETRVEEWLKELRNIVADMRSVEAQASTLDANARKEAELKIEERLNLNDESGHKINIFTREQLTSGFPEDSIQKIVRLLSVTPGINGQQYVFPHDSNPLEYRNFVTLSQDEFCFLDPSSAHRVVAKAFEQAILEQGGPRDRYLKNRDAATEQRVAESLRKSFPNAEFYRNYYFEKGQFEKDLLVRDDDVVLIVECKNAKVRGFNGTADDLVKFDRDFEHSVQYCYDQANDVKQRIVGSNGEVTFYDKKGREYFSLNKSEVEQIFILCVTLTPRGPFGTNLSLQLKKLPDEPFPLALSMFDLETICHHFSGKQLLKYLAARSKLHGRVHTGDELNFAGYFLKYGHLTAKDGTHLADDFSEVFDRRWHREKGINVPEPANLPVEIGMIRRGNRIVIDKSYEQAETIQIAPEIYEHITDHPIIRMKGSDRNKPCPCGSGRKLKRCHGTS